MFLRTINKSQSNNNRYKKILLSSALILGIVSDSNVIPEPLFNANFNEKPGHPLLVVAQAGAPRRSGGAACGTGPCTCLATQTRAGAPG